MKATDKTLRLNKRGKTAERSLKNEVGGKAAPFLPGVPKRKGPKPSKR